MKLHLLKTDLLPEYKKSFQRKITAGLKKLPATPPSFDFTFYNAVSAMSSSKIEGEQMDIDSYIKHKTNGIKYNKDLTEKPNDLFVAYEFAQENNFSKANFLKAHKLISKHLLPPQMQGVYRHHQMTVVNSLTHQITYTACDARLVETEMDKLFTDIDSLMWEHLTDVEVFYFAAYIHLMFVKIHPFDDGNGRSARLLEKWFMAEKLNRYAWCIQSELYYFQNLQSYYNGLKMTGAFYDTTASDKVLPFLSLLPKALL
jgi:Fic family protein